MTPYFITSSPSKSHTADATASRTIFANRDPTAISTTRVTLKFFGAQWEAILSDPVAAAAFTLVFIDSIASGLGIPSRFIVNVRFSIGSLIVVFDVLRNTEFQISDSQLASALNNNEIYSTALGYYTNVTGDVSAGLLEPVVLVQILPAGGPVCGEVCIGLCSGASVLVASAAFSLWYIFFYRAAELRARAKKRQLRQTQKQENEPLEPSSASETDSEPFNESVIPPSGSKMREPFDTHENVFDNEDDHNDERRAGNAFDFSSPYGAPEGEDQSPRPQFESSREPFEGFEAKEPLFDASRRSQPKADSNSQPLSRCASTSSVDIKPPPAASAFEGE